MKKGINPNDHPNSLPRITHVGNAYEDVEELNLHELKTI